MRIALFTDGIYPYVIGGMQKHSIEMAKSFARIGVDVDLYHCVLNDDTIIANIEGLNEIENERIHSFCLRFPKSKKYPGHYLKESLKYSEEILKLYIKNNRRADLIYAQGFCGWSAMKNSKRENLPPIAVNFHGLNMFQKSFGIRAKLQNILLRTGAKWNISHADINVVLSNKLLRLIRTLLKPNQKTIVQPNAIQQHWFEEPCVKEQNELNLVFVGRNDRVKGLDILMNVLKEIDQETKNTINVHIIGSSIEKSKYQFLKITSYGQISDEKVIKQILSGAHALVLPSLSEGFPTVVLEAMSRKCVIISSDVGAVSDLVTEENGWLVKPGSSQELKDALLSLINAFENNKLKQMSNRSFEKASLYTWEGVTAGFIKDVKMIL